MKQKNFVYELAEYVHQQDPEETKIVVETFKRNLDDIPEKYRAIMWSALTKKIKDIPEYIENRYDGGFSYG